MSAPRQAPEGGITRGFTILEALIALFVLAIGMLGCASLLVWSLFQSGAALRHELALGMASDLAERVRAKGVVPTAAELAQWQAQGTAALPLEASLEVFPPAAQGELERIDVIVRWTEPRTASGYASLVVRIHRRAG